MDMATTTLYNLHRTFPIVTYLTITAKTQPSPLKSVSVGHLHIHITLPYKAMISLVKIGKVQIKKKKEIYRARFGHVCELLSIEDKINFFIHSTR